MSKDIEETWVNIPANPAAKSAQSNKADTNDIDRLEDAKKLMEWERYDDPTLLEYLRYYKGGIIGEVHIEAAIAQETNKARLDEVQRLVNAVHRGDEPNTYVSDRYFELKQLTAEKGSNNE